MKNACLAMLLLGCFAACAVEGQSAEQTGPQESQDTTAQASTNVDQIWRLYDGPENCVDHFGHPCSSTSPGGNCPAGITEGTPCFVPSLTFCFQVIHNGRDYNLFQCF